MRKIFIIILAATVFLAGGVAANAQVCPAEADYLARAIASSYGDLSFGGKVGIAAVALNMKESGLAETLPGAVAALFAEGEFWELGKLAGEIDEEMYRICKDAVDAAINGADPTGGALHLHSFYERARVDLQFDDTREEELAKKMRRELERLARESGGGTPMLIDNVGFY